MSVAPVSAAAGWRLRLDRGNVGGALLGDLGIVGDLTVLVLHERVLGVRGKPLRGGHGWFIVHVRAATRGRLGLAR
jgi:hypothetical protein